MTVPSAPPPPADGPREPELWWSPSLNAVVGKHKYGECFAVIELDDMGWRDTDELSELPADAVPLVLAPAVAVPAEARDDDLAEAERRIRHNASMPNPKYADERILLAEYDRRAQEIARLVAAVSSESSAKVSGFLTADTWKLRHDHAVHVRDVALARIDTQREAIANRDSHVNRLLGQVAAVRALHKATFARDSNGYPIEVCGHEGFEWPCPTVAALDGSVGSPEPTLAEVTNCHSCQSAAKAAAGSPETGDTGEDDEYVPPPKGWWLDGEEEDDEAPNSTDTLVSQMVYRLGMGQRLMPWPELTQDLAFLAINLDAARGSDTATPDPAAASVATDDFIDALYDELPAVVTFPRDALERAVAAALSGTATTEQPRTQTIAERAAAMGIKPQHLDDVLAPGALLGTYADPDFRAHQDHKHPVEGCGFCPQEEDR